MRKWPEFDNNGDLPVGIHRATLPEVLQHFGTGTVQRQLVGQRLERIYNLALGTGQMARFWFLRYGKTFSRGYRIWAVQNVIGASVFWIRRLAAIGGEREALLRYGKTFSRGCRYLYDDGRFV